MADNLDSLYVWNSTFNARTRLRDIQPSDFCTELAKFVKTECFEAFGRDVILMKTFGKDVNLLEAFRRYVLKPEVRFIY